jgi:hypothetical protein
MLTLTPAASAQFAAYFKDRPVHPIRIFLDESG